MDDRISTLPDEILHYILSLLSTEEAVATSALSKRWAPVWLSLTTLILKPRKPRFNFDVPCSILRCRDLVVLKLTRTSVNVDFYNVDFPDLKTLHLDHVNFSENRCLVEFFIGCPNLEHLEAHEIYIKSGRFESEYYGLLPKLVSATISATGFLSFPLSILSNVEFLRAKLHSNKDVPEFPNLTHLELIFPGIIQTFSRTVSWTQLVFDMLENCPKLLSLVADVREQRGFPRQQPEDIRYVPDAVANCLCSQFRNCTITNYSRRESERLFVEYIMQNSSSLETMTIHSILPSLFPTEEHRLLAKLSLRPKSFANCVLSFQ